MPYEGVMGPHGFGQPGAGSLVSDSESQFYYPTELSPKPSLDASGRGISGALLLLKHSCGCERR
jgi:hypothetical protein